MIWIVGKENAYQKDLCLQGISVVGIWKQKHKACEQTYHGYPSLVSEVLEVVFDDRCLDIDEW